MPGVEASTAPSGPPRITWTHPQEGFLRLSLLNAALRVLTLGVYHFWGKTEVRQRIWAAVRIDGEPLEYRGTGRELFLGFLIVFGVVLVPLVVVGFAPLFWADADDALQAGSFLLLFALGGLGIFRARRYRLSRTQWRGIRGGLTGSALRFAWLYFWTMLLIPLSLGWIIPWRATRLQHALFNGTHFGDKVFVFTGRSGPLYKRYWLVWTSAIFLFGAATGAIFAVWIGPHLGVPSRPDDPPPMPTGRQAVAMIGIALVALVIFAMIRAWYGSRMLNYFASETTYQGCKFRLNTSVPSLMWLVATNYLMRLLSLGVLAPIAEARIMRYLVQRLSLEGSVDWGAIEQNPQALLARGEGLAEAFDVDAF
jgi:uncharacterized membrane protein YjgN (DUF898 family)